jgi:hypothetical protein
MIHVHTLGVGEHPVDSGNRNAGISGHAADLASTLRIHRGHQRRKCERRDFHRLMSASRAYAKALGRGHSLKILAGKS